MPSVDNWKQQPPVKGDGGMWNGAQGSSRNKPRIPSQNVRPLNCVGLIALRVRLSKRCQFSPARALCFDSVFYHLTRIVCAQYLLCFVISPSEPTFLALRWNPTSPTRVCPNAPCVGTQWLFILNRGNVTVCNILRYWYYDKALLLVIAIVCIV